MGSKLNKKLIKGSFILLIAFGLFNFFHFLFQFLMVRKLSVADYGILASLFAIIYISAILAESIQTIVTKYSVNEDNKGKLKNLFKKSMRKAFYLASYAFIAYLIIAIALSRLLKIDYFLLAITGTVIFLAFLTPVSRGVMQGRKRFFSLGGNLLAEAVLKLAIGVSLVVIGWRVYGAIIGAILGGLTALLFSFAQLRDVLKSKEEKSVSAGIYKYARPTFFITAVVVIFYSMDVLIAKMLFEPDVAGAYAIASILGKIIFWGTLPISKAMFPISAQEENGQKIKANAFGNALVLVFLGVIALLSAFYFAPEIIIKIFKGEIISEAVSVLFFVGLAFGIISIANLILLYKLSIGRTKRYAIMAAFLFIEVFLLVYFSKDLVQFSIAFVVASVAFLWGAITLLDKD